MSFCCMTASGPTRDISPAEIPQCSTSCPTEKCYPFGPKYRALGGETARLHRGARPSGGAWPLVKGQSQAVKQ
jgi:hypothetical protein